jgi:hypothetical protein
MKRSIILSGLAALVLVCGPSSGQHEKDGVAVFTPQQVKWTDGPPSLPPGAKAALLDGNPAKEGPFVLRVKLPDGYRIAPHTHTTAERITVLSGTFFIGMGDKFDTQKGMEMPAGSFGTWPAGMKHFAWVKGETIIQLNGTGPWTITYVNPEDDPRNAKK